MSATMTSMAAPARSYEQRMEALAKANRIRGERARLKRDLKAGRVGVVPLVLEPSEFVDTMKVCALLLAAPKLGRVKVSQVVRRVGVSPSRSLGGLSVRQRVELAGLLRERGVR